jgi:hypothetical protein
MLKLPASQTKENVMSMALGIALYLFPGLALSLLRRSQGMHGADALFCGLFWPFDMARRGIELLVRGLVQTDAA